MERSPQVQPARPLRLGAASVYTGTCSWTKGFEDWYPPGLRSSSAGRLRYYARHFPATEIDATYYALLPPEQAVPLACGILDSCLLAPPHAPRSASPKAR